MPYRAELQGMSAAMNHVDDAISQPQLEVVHEEQHFLLVNKPSRLFTQAAPGIPSVETELRQFLRERDRHPGTPFIGLPHRLDRATSGILLVARNQRALKRFGEQFQARKVGKFYLAAVACRADCPDLDGGEQLLEDYLCKVPDRPLAEVCSAQHPGAKLARMIVEPVWRQGDYRLCLVHLLTGRMHQIRLQLAARGWPVLGDAIYGVEAGLAGTAPTAETEPENPAGEMALHALRLEFLHPKTGKLTSGTAALPATWAALPDGIHEAAEEMVARSRSVRGRFRPAATN